MAAFSNLSFPGILLIFLVVHVAATHGITEDEILKRLLKGYDPTVRPNSGETRKPTVVKVNFYLRDMYTVDNSQEHMGMQLTFRQEWNDSRLAYPETEIRYLALKDVNRIWRPDLFFSNTRKEWFHDIMEPNTLVRIFPDGQVLYSRRVSGDFRCSTETKNYPLNKIMCSVVAASYGFTTEDIIFIWKEGDPVRISKQLSVARSYEIFSLGGSFCTSRTITGEYSCLRSDFMLEPHCGAVFSAVYMPHVVLVLLGWLSFFMHRRNVKVRLPLLLVLLVLGVFCCANSSWQKPDRLVTTAADVWGGTCLTFVIYALVHFILTRNVPCLARACGYDERKDEDRTAIVMKPILSGEGGEIAGEGSTVKSKLQSTTSRIRHLVTKQGNRADIIARILYPSAFIIFNVVYWSAYNGFRGI